MDFLEPRYSVREIALYYMRRWIVEELRAALPSFSGTLLDVGCGGKPYRQLLTGPGSRVTTYLGLDLFPPTLKRDAWPEIGWDGELIPLADGSVDCVIATEVLEHCPAPSQLVGEVYRVLRSGGKFFATTPFLWSLHEVPHDQQRLTPFALNRVLTEAGFDEVAITAPGGWDASLALVLALWLNRRPMGRPLRALLLILLSPIVRLLMARETTTVATFTDGLLIPMICVTASKSRQPPDSNGATVGT